MSFKRERCVNWDSDEKQLLRSIIRPYLHIIENKNISTNTNRRKMLAWSEVTEKFNTVNKRKRIKKQLMTQWKCYKQQCKKQRTTIRREIFKTGGGFRPPTPPKASIQNGKVLPQELATNYNEFECDDTKISGCIDPSITIKTEDDVAISTIMEQVLVEPSITIPETVTATPLHKTQLPNTKKKEEFDLRQATYLDIHKYREKENDRLQREHELRMKIMLEQHEQTMRNLRLQEQVWRQRLNLEVNKK